jgi:hypothetical protein
LELGILDGKLRTWIELQECDEGSEKTTNAPAAPAEFEEWLMNLAEKPILRFGRAVDQKFGCRDLSEFQLWMTLG